MTEFYPTKNVLMNKLRHMAGHQTGIIESQVLFSARPKYSPQVQICTGQMPAYHKLVLNENVEISYHLSGYGITREESTIKLIGESIERYALVTAPVLYADKFIKASYNELAERYPNEVIPFDLLNIYSEKDYEKLAKCTSLEALTKDDCITWLRCPSLIDKDQFYFIPIQMLFIGNRDGKKEKMFVPGFSKGSASHISLEKALASAIMEAIEADAVMINWYCEREVPEIIIDDLSLVQTLDEIMKRINFKIHLLDYSVNETIGYTFVAILENEVDEAPKYVMGCAAGLNPTKVAYRAIMEALAILYLADNGPLVMPKDYLENDLDLNFTNLDSNVSYWSNMIDLDKKKELITKIMGEKRLLSDYDNLESKDDILYILEKSQELFKYAVYFDMTPPEIKDMGHKVLRVFLPEFLQMSFPEFPYSNHPRFSLYGGVKCELPHPLP